MPNDNIITAVSHFDPGGYGYKSANAADFGALSPNGTFAAAVTCLVRGEYQAASIPDAQYLWGTLDVANPVRGWAISIEDNVTVPGQAAVTARIGLAGTDTAAVQYNISGPGLPSFVSRLMQIGLFYVPEGDGVLYLTINGAVVAASAELDDAYAPSAYPVCMGLEPNGTTAGAQRIDIAAAGYAYNFNCSDRDDVGFFAQHAFDAERAAYTGGAVYNEIGLDWVHRYCARTLAANLPASIVKYPASARLLADQFPNPNGYAAVPVGDWPDVGNLMVTDPSFPPQLPYNPVPLVRQGALTDGFVALPFLAARKNVDWYAGGAYEFPAA